MEVAPQHAETQRDVSWEGVKERLFLDRIHLQRPHIAPRHQKLAVCVEPDTADPLAPRPNAGAVSVFSAPTNATLATEFSSSMVIFVDSSMA